jgi:hypothetical protein
MTTGASTSRRLKRRLGVPTWIKVAVVLVSLAFLTSSVLALLLGGDPKSVTVIRPTDSTLAFGEEVEVDVRGLHEGEVVWFVTQGAKDQGINSRYRPTPEPKRSIGDRWVRDVYAGDADDEKKVFHIHVVAATSDARQVFLDYSATAVATETFEDGRPWGRAAMPVAFVRRGRAGVLSTSRRRSCCGTAGNRTRPRSLTLTTS